MKYKIKEVEKITGISAYTIRYYEKEGILPPIDRDENGVRMFNDDNLYWLDLVTCFKNTDMPVKDIKEIVRLSQIGDATIEERKEILKGHRKTIENQIKELKNSLKKIDKKIDFYEGTGEC
ncbi:MAG: MerR family transcriptional regulator [Clostridia bacterium]|jgi:DNA-binding transcriptional MerR regulator|nr:MerR family transcriptional regulator [Clostridia bacterium]